jgi:copper oxidase (laccase) domain-containing protein
VNESLLEFEWKLPSGVRAAFTTRLGGVSVAPWDSLNLGAHVGDAADAVAENRRRVRTLLGLKAEPAWLNQVHGVGVCDLDSKKSRDKPVTADASIATGREHAGWRGLASGVLEHTVLALGVPGSELTAWMGPAISREHFEVGNEVRAAFVSQDAGASAAFTANARGKWQADLVALARRRLNALGVSDVRGGEWCTFADPSRFFSHRRDGKGGRMAALIWRE